MGTKRKKLSGRIRARLKRTRKINKEAARLGEYTVARMLNNIHECIVRLENKLDDLKRENAPVPVQTAAEGDQ